MNCNLQSYVTQEQNLPRAKSAEKLRHQLSVTAAAEL